tara:strand:- start:3063 stop:3791 length:729 start_codon:yes stop_codon:yes gene_type:complete
MNLVARILLSILVFVFISCRGTTMKDTPIHLNPNMDNVERLDPQSKNKATYFDGDSMVLISPNGASMLNPLKGTVSRPNDESEFNEEQWSLGTGRYKGNGVWDEGEEFVDANANDIYDEGEEFEDIRPYIMDLSLHYIVNEEFIIRGEERYNINCSPCHGLSGDGKGIVVSDNFSWKKVAVPPDFHAMDKEEWTKDGYIYEVISGGPDGTGFGQMGPYKDISVEDRWKIVAYIRALTHKDEQ